ncbi:putative membrane protein SpoIIM required for sporulation [Wenyingzhuangia heitensis]|uniref:Membrane protein SpoIIM required for sporulation n=1 Tax=Wenyingzhuangia heitensis TaxID=1487859 RepID=A0ABX0U9Q4_9FLAO|nr:stage II sporulation protein M [Wenyingzhuangia heitensis]NIJ44201.1 putative membrane protein SpoIIM required for sporulation [Wenyingzhuangia heitensis]
MREIAFIKQNKEKWLRFESAINEKNIAHPEELSKLYLHLINDLAFAQTYYKKSKLVVYLNHLTILAFQKIYKSKKEDKNRLLHFFMIDVPLLLYSYKKYIYYSFVIFGLSVAIGLISAIYDDSFVRLILSDGYVNETLENIKNGNPTAVYKSGSNWGSFIGITFNNLYVGLKAFVLGVTGGIGTAYVLLQNGIMLGAFQYFFAEQGVLLQSIKGIWIHGAMEIFAIVIEGAVGLILGASILFPNTLTRVDSFKKGMRNGIKIMIATFPFTIAAGFLEGFVSRYGNSMPTFLALVIILGTLSIIAYYFLIYPFKIAKKVTSDFTLV